MDLVDLAGLGTSSPFVVGILFVTETSTSRESGVLPGVGKGAEED